MYCGICHWGLTCMKCTKTLKTIFFGIVILLLMFSFIPFNSNGYALIDLDKCSTHTGKITHYVGGYGPGNYTYIQDAIDYEKSLAA